RTPTWFTVLVSVLCLAAIALWVQEDIIIHSPFDLLQRDVLKIVFENAESFAIVAAVILYFKSAPDRKAQKHYNAWQIIDAAAAAKLSTSYARFQALQDLHQDGVPLRALESPGANLNRIQLPEANLAEANLQGADLREACLQRATLSKAVLRGANLQNANLRGADLQGADLYKASLALANLSGTNLCGANLVEVNLTNANFSGANVEFARFGNNAGLSEEMQANLQQRGAIFTVDS
ncbi:MAG: pentapeptide repeat-containing protein, partial [Microcoleus sp. SM1_3_4]|nr:pentapeptide repeat-containing protein [Microcoleus sp. SM1_3_4]